ncbi:MAG: ABC transporter substrate-binding protein, partial [Chloroflexota bacterium]
RIPAVKLAFVPVGVLALLAVLACGAPAPSSSPAQTPDDITSLSGGTLRVSMDIAQYESFQVGAGMPFNWSLDPQATWAPEPWELFRCCLLRTLMSYNGQSVREGGAELRPDLAAGYPTISADGLTWTFTLKDGLHYAPPMADTPIVAQDVIRGIERALRPYVFGGPGQGLAFSPYAPYLSDVIAGAQEFSKGAVSTISGLEAPDAQTLVVHLTQPSGDLGNRLALPAAAPIPAGAADGHDTGYGRYLVASGPYMLEGSDALNPSLPPDQQPKVSGYVPGMSITMVRNPSWDRSTDSLRAAYADRIVISQSNNYDDELSAILANNLDLQLSSDLDPMDIARFRADSQIAPSVHVTPALASDWIMMNLAVPPFDDVHVRRAVNLATNKQAIVNLLHPEGVVQAHAIPDAFENDLLKDYNPYATVDNAGSVDKAKAEMALSAYDSNGDGVCDQPACTGIYVAIRDDRPEVFPAAQNFAASLAPLGVMLDLEHTDAATFRDSFRLPENKGAIAFTVGWNSDYLNAASWFGPLATSDLLGSDFGSDVSLIGASVDQLSGWGYSITSVPDLEAPIDACSASVGEAQFECWAHVDQYLMERIAPWVPLDTRQNARLTSAGVTRFRFDAALTMPALDQISVAGTAAP